MKLLHHKNLLTSKIVENHKEHHKNFCDVEVSSCAFILSTITYEPFPVKNIVGLYNTDYYKDYLETAMCINNKLWVHKAHICHLRRNVWNCTLQ